MMPELIHPPPKDTVADERHYLAVVPGPQRTAFSLWDGAQPRILDASGRARGSIRYSNTGLGSVGRRDEVEPGLTKLRSLSEYHSAVIQTITRLLLEKTEVWELWVQAPLQAQERLKEGRPHGDARDNGDGRQGQAQVPEGASSPDSYALQVALLSLPGMIRTRPTPLSTVAVQREELSPWISGQDSNRDDLQIIRALMAGMLPEGTSLPEDLKTEEWDSLALGLYAQEAGIMAMVRGEQEDKEDDDD